MASWSMFQDQETNKFTKRLNNKWRTQNVDTASYPARVYYELQKKYRWLENITRPPQRGFIQQIIFCSQQDPSQLSGDELD